MEAIRDAIKILFHDIKANSILNLQKKCPNKYADDEIDGNLFCRLIAAKRGEDMTLDGIDSIYVHMKEQWMKPEENLSVCFAKRSSVFNVLLHFTSVVLIERNQEPVCHYEHLLRWHDAASLLGEDLLTTSFLAARDLQNHYHREAFNWPMSINHDNRALNGLFRKSLYDLHFHLKGSSLNFELNWMSLMNKTSRREKQFKKMHDVLHQITVVADDECNEPFNLRALKAATLRMLLFEYVINNHNLAAISLVDKKKAISVLNAASVQMAATESKEIDFILQRLRHKYGKRYNSTDGTLRIPDYATIERLTYHIEKSDYQYVFTTLSGERWLMYELFRDIYLNNKIPQEVVAWFYAYLLYKAQFRTEIVQNNRFVGFANFVDYERRKSLFISEHSVYAILLSQMAVLEFIQNADNRFVEVRIAPKGLKSSLIKYLHKTEQNLVDSHFLSGKIAETLLQNYCIVLHFIKKEDNKSTKTVCKGICRHYDLRYEVKKQAYAIWHLRNSENQYRSIVHGIDAANSEVYARPEVFAQAYRFLRESTMNPKKMQCHDLGMTYHVGEDFIDVIDGLRAIDEVRQFLGFRNGDRIGHGMVLGIDVNAYYQRCHANVIMTKQLLLDNVVWLYYKGKDLPSFVAASKDLEVIYNTYYSQIFGQLEIGATMHDYLLSWALRGDNPQYYFHSNEEVKHCQNSRWDMFDLNNSEFACLARKNGCARKLYSAYHFDERIRNEGEITIQAHLSDSIVVYITDVQKKMLNEIERDNICIECNPTSNLRIGHFDSYSTHPIVRMFNYMLPTDEDMHNLSVTINTDDKGVFATSLEREYSLLALSLEKKYVKTSKCSPRQIYEWLDEIRSNGENYVF